MSTANAAALTAPAFAVDTRASISRTRSDCQARPSSACLASTGEGARLMRSITTSTLDSATARPSRMWPRSRAFFSSNTVRRVTTSRRWPTNASIMSFRFSRRGWLSTSATMFMPKLSCSWVCLNRLLSTTSGSSPRFNSTTTRMPSLSDSSRMSEMPSIFFSVTSSAMRSSSDFLLTW